MSESIKAGSSHIALSDRSRLYCPCEHCRLRPVFPVGRRGPVFTKIGPFSQFTFHLAPILRMRCLQLLCGTPALKLKADGADSCDGNSQLPCCFQSRLASRREPKSACHCSADQTVRRLRVHRIASRFVRPEFSLALRRIRTEPSHRAIKTRSSPIPPSIKLWPPRAKAVRSRAPVSRLASLATSLAARYSRRSNSGTTIRDQLAWP